MCNAGATILPFHIDSDKATKSHAAQRNSEVHAEEGHSSVSNALFNALCFSMGAGFLGIPHCFSVLGLVPGIVSLVFFAGICSYTSKLLSRCMLYEDEGSCKRRITTYVDLGLVAGGERWKNFVQIVLGVNQFGIAVLYLVLLADNMNELLGVVFGGSESTSHCIWVVIYAVAVAPVVCIPQLRELSIISAFGVFSILFVWVVAMVEMGNGDAKPHPNQEHATRDLLSVSGSLGTLIFAFGGAPVFPSIQTSMKEPSKFTRASFGAFGIMFCVFASVGILGYITFGTQANPDVLKMLPSNIASKAAIIGITAHLYAATPMVLYPLVQLLETRFLGKLPKVITYGWFAKSATIRCSVLALAALLAVMVPFFADILSLLGATTETMMVLVFPVIFYEMLYHSQVKRHQRVLHIVVVVFAAYLMTTGSYNSVKDIIAHWHEYKLF